MTNNQAKAYMVLAMKKAGCSSEQIRRAARVIHYLMDDTDEAEAERQAAKLLGEVVEGN